jgi:class 3 adenylate cyclase
LPRSLAADVAGYSRLMEADEEGTHERLKTLRHELLDPKIAEHHGRTPAGCSSLIRSMIRCATGCRLSLRIWASSRSRTYITAV